MMFTILFVLPFTSSKAIKENLQNTMPDMHVVLIVSGNDCNKCMKLLQCDVPVKVKQLSPSASRSAALHHRGQPWRASTTNNRTSTSSSHHRFSTHTLTHQTAFPKVSSTAFLFAGGTPTAFASHSHPDKSRRTQTNIRQTSPTLTRSLQLATLARPRR